MQFCRFMGLSDSDEKYEIQENVFMRWANSLLANDPIKVVFFDHKYSVLLHFQNDVVIYPQHISTVSSSKSFTFSGY